MNLDFVISFVILKSKFFSDVINFSVHCKREMGVRIFLVKGKLFHGSLVRGMFKSVNLERSTFAGVDIPAVGNFHVHRKQRGGECWLSPYDIKYCKGNRVRFCMIGFRSFGKNYVSVYYFKNWKGKHQTEQWQVVRDWVLIPV